MVIGKHIHVVAGIIWNQNKDQILISKRPDHLHKGGFWEFPGGKVEKNESSLQALARELHEELNICYKEAEPFQSITYDYPEKTVSLDFFHVYHITSEVKPNEGQQFCWVSLSDLKDFRFPEANEPVVERLLELFAS